MTDEQTIRLAAFLGVLAMIAVWELIAPRQKLTDSKQRRWFANLSLVAINTVAVRFIVPVLPTGMTLLAKERGWGMFNQTDLPEWVAIVIAVIALDFVIYLQHVL